MSAYHRSRDVMMEASMVGSWASECKSSPESQGGQERQGNSFSPRDSQRSQDSWLLYFSPVKLIWGFWTPDCKILMCCFKPQVYNNWLQHHRKLMHSITIYPTKPQNTNEKGPATAARISWYQNLSWKIRGMEKEPFTVLVPESLCVTIMYSRNF